MTTIPQLTEKQTEALDVLVDLYGQSRGNNPEARAAFLSATLLLAQRNVLGYLVAALLVQAQVIEKMVGPWGLEPQTSTVSR
jgi:hypothetical protein